MNTFVDTSALYATLDANDKAHLAAAAAWRELVLSRHPLATHSYVLMEAFALVQDLLGVEAARTMQEDIVPLLTVHGVDAALHGAAVAALLTAGRRDLSLVDCVSFELMRRLGLRRAFTLDAHFAEQGFEVVPA